MLRIHVDQLVEMDAGRYLEAPGRREDVEGLAASIAELGVLTPLTVIPSGEGRWTIYAGHRRRSAAIRAAELVRADPEAYGLSAEQAAERAAELLRLPCHERPDLDRAGRDVLTQIAENRERLDLDDASVARGLQMALLDGLNAREVAAATGIKRSTVQAAEKITALPESAQAALAGGQLSLDEAAQLEEFAEDGKAMERILRSHSLPYALADERQRRTTKQARDTLRAQLTTAGHTVIGKPKGFGWDSKAEALEWLADDGVSLPAEDAAPVEGHAVFIDAYGGRAIATHVCLDPEAHGHTRKRRSQYVTDAERDRREAEEQARRERVEQLQVAREVRHQFLDTLTGTQKAAAKHGGILTTVAARWPRLLDRPRDEEPAADWTPGRLHQFALTRAVLGLDGEADRDAKSLTRWSIETVDASLWWWDTLVGLGYALSPIETQQREGLRLAEERITAQIEAEATEDEEDEDADAFEDAEEQDAGAAAIDRIRLVDDHEDDGYKEREPIDWDALEGGDPDGGDGEVGAIAV